MQGGARWGSNSCEIINTIISVLNCKWSLVALAPWCQMQYFPFRVPFSQSCTGHLQCYHSATSLIMHWLREFCGPQYKSYFCVKENTVICLLYSQKPEATQPLPQPSTLCLPTAATFTGIYEMINNLKLQVVAQTNAEIIQMPTTIWRMSFIQAPLQCRFIFPAVNHAHMVRCSVSYCHLHITLCWSFYGSCSQQSCYTQLSCSLLPVMSDTPPHLTDVL